MNRGCWRPSMPSGPGIRPAPILRRWPRWSGDWRSLRGLYGGAAKGAAAPGADDSIKAAGRETLLAMDTIRNLDLTHYQPTTGVVYPTDEVSQAFRQVAALLKGDVGLEIACLDMGGW